MNNSDDGWPPMDRIIRDWDDGGVRVKPRDLRDEFAMRIMSAMISNN